MKMMMFLATPVFGVINLRAFSNSASPFAFQNASSSSPSCSLGTPGCSTDLGALGWWPRGGSAKVWAARISRSKRIFV